MINESARLKEGINKSSIKSVTFPLFPFSKLTNLSPKFPKAPPRTNMKAYSSILFANVFLNWKISQINTNEDKRNVNSALPFNNPNAIPVLKFRSISYIFSRMTKSS